MNFGGFGYLNMTEAPVRSHNSTCTLFSRFIHPYRQLKTLSCSWEQWQLSWLSFYGAAFRSIKRRPKVSSSRIVAKKQFLQPCPRTLTKDPRITTALRMIRTTITQVESQNRISSRFIAKVLIYVQNSNVPIKLGETSRRSMYVHFFWIKLYCYKKKTQVFIYKWMILFVSFDISSLKSMRRTPSSHLQVWFRELKCDITSSQLLVNGGKGVDLKW